MPLRSGKAWMLRLKNSTFGWVRQSRQRRPSATVPHSAGQVVAAMLASEGFYTAKGRLRSPAPIFFETVRMVLRQRRLTTLVVPARRDRLILEAIFSVWFGASTARRRHRPAGSHIPVAHALGMLHQQVVIPWGGLSIWRPRNVESAGKHCVTASRTLATVLGARLNALRGAVLNR